jgi:hypothetical protein
MVGPGHLIPLAVALGAVMLAGLGLSVAVRGPLRVLGLAVATGVTYGVTAGLMKVVAGQFRLGFAEPFEHWALYAIFVIGPVGFLLSQNTFQQGRLISPALAVITTVDPLVGVAIGVWWMGESAATGTLVLIGELLAAVVIVAGIALLARRSADLVRHGPTGGSDRTKPPPPKLDRPVETQPEPARPSDDADDTLSDSVTWATWPSRSGF